MLSGVWQHWLTDLEYRVRELEQNRSDSMLEAAKGAVKPILAGVALVIYARLRTGSWPEQEAISALLGLG